MAWTYGDPAASAHNEVRLLAGDTDQNQPWTLQDNEIDYFVALYSDSPPVIGRNFYAAAEACGAIIAKLKGTVADKRVGDLSVTYNTPMLQEFVHRKAELMRKATIQGVGIYVGGISIADKEANDDDTDRVKPAFEVDGMTKIGNTIDPWRGW